MFTSHTALNQHYTFLNKRTTSQVEAETFRTVDEKYATILMGFAFVESRL